MSGARVNLAGAVVIGSTYQDLGAIRSLGRRGVPVWVLAGEQWVGRATRYAQRTFNWPPHGDAEQLDFLTQLSQRYGLENWALFPGKDQDAALIAQHHAELSQHFVLTTPPWTILRWAHDKRLTYRLASEIDIDHPLTFHPTSLADVERLECPFPAILKPALKDQENALTAAKAWRVDDRAQLLRRYAEARAVMDPSLIMVQELIPGGGEAQFSYAALCVSGRPVASIVVRRARQWPVDFGRSSTYVESIHLPEIEKLAERVLAAIGFSGLVEVEFKRDPRSGNYRLLDVNPRLWGWHSIGRAAGVDFPYLAWTLLKGDIFERKRGRPGIRWVHGVTDLPMILLEMVRGKLSLFEYLRSIRPPIESAVFAVDDPLPALVELPMVLYLLWHRRQEFASLLPRSLGAGGRSA